MTDKDKNIAQEFKERLSKIVDLLDFRVFGSRARENADEYSDMDVFLEVERIDEVLEAQIQKIAWEVGFKNFVHISPLIFTRYEILETPLRSSFIVQNIVEEGIKV